MGAPVELKTEWTDPSQERPQATWSAPRAAYSQYRPGLSPYMHYWQQLRARRNQAPPPPDHGADDGSNLPGQMTEALDEMIRRGFGT